MKKNFFLAMACAVVILSSCSSGQPAGKISAWKAKHVFLIGIDGWGSYSMKQAKVPNIRDLMANGSYTLEKRSVLPSSSAVNWASMYMGAGPELHGYCEWGSQVPDLPSRVVNRNGIFPTVFSELRSAAPEAEIGNIYEWDGIRYLVDTLSLSYDKHVVEVAEDSTAVTRFIVDYIKDKKPTLLNVQYDVLDHVGHAAGHDTPMYYAKLEEIDGYIGQIVKAAKDAGIWEETIIIVTADHGGIGKTHGGRTMAEMETPFVICGKSIKKGYQIEESMMQYDVASTIASIFALQQPQVWVGRPVSVFE